MVRSDWPMPGASIAAADNRFEPHAGSWGIGSNPYSSGRRLSSGTGEAWLISVQMLQFSVAMPPSSTLRRPVVICLSHLRWNFVFQRPQHLMSRYAAVHRVYFVEEPLLEDIATPQVSIERSAGVS